MKELCIVSGKGGTGKTTVTAAFASLAKNKVMADCDVDAADLHLLLSPEVRQREAFIGARTPCIDYELCSECGDCQSWCRFDAIGLDFDQGFLIDPLACEHCGLCALVCPEEAIRMEDAVSGEWMVSDTRFGTLVHARLGIGEDNSGKLVTIVRREARRLAEAQDADLIISDGPPGIGCPVTSAITGVDLVLAVTEPTPSGIHDLERVASLCRHFSAHGLHQQARPQPGEHRIHPRLVWNKRDRCGRRYPVRPGGHPRTGGPPQRCGLRLRPGVGSGRAALGRGLSPPGGVQPLRLRRSGEQRSAAHAVCPGALADSPYLWDSLTSLHNWTPIGGADSSAPHLERLERDRENGLPGDSRSRLSRPSPCLTRPHCGLHEDFGRHCAVTLLRCCREYYLGSCRRSGCQTRELRSA